MKKVLLEKFLDKLKIFKTLGPRAINLLIKSTKVVNKTWSSVGLGY